MENFNKNLGKKMKLELEGNSTSKLRDQNLNFNEEKTHLKDLTTNTNFQKIKHPEIHKRNEKSEKILEYDTSKLPNSIQKAWKSYADEKNGIKINESNLSNDVSITFIDEKFSRKLNKNIPCILEAQDHLYIEFSPPKKFGRYNSYIPIPSEIELYQKGYLPKFVPCYTVKEISGISAIYFIQNWHPSGEQKIYIGQTTLCLKERFINHASINSKMHIHNAILKYGKDAFSISKLIEIRNRPQFIVNAYELYLIVNINTFNPELGYNHALPDSSPNRGNELKIEHRNKISKSNFNVKILALLEKNPIAQKSLQKAILEANNLRILAENLKITQGEARMLLKYYCNTKIFYDAKKNIEDGKKINFTKEKPVIFDDLTILLGHFKLTKPELEKYYGRSETSLKNTLFQIYHTKSIKKARKIAKSYIEQNKIEIEKYIFLGNAKIIPNNIIDPSMIERQRQTKLIHFFQKHYKMKETNYDEQIRFISMIKVKIDERIKKFVTLDEISQYFEVEIHVIRNTLKHLFGTRNIRNIRTIKEEIKLN